MVVVVDYGMGNLRSVSKALDYLGARASVTSDPEAVSRAEKLVLPGVGAFPAAMRELTQRRLTEPIKQVIASGRPYLGICLGLQLLFGWSDEGEGAKGLEVLPGTVRRLPGAGSLKIPHMGWNQVTRSANGCPLLKEIPQGGFFYFVHSYYGDPSDPALVTLEAEYGSRFAAMVWRHNVYATQFHPEKSQALGLRLLENFLRL